MDWLDEEEEEEENEATELFTTGTQVELIPSKQPKLQVPFEYKLNAQADISSLVFAELQVEFIARTQSMLQVPFLARTAMHCLKSAISEGEYVGAVVGANTGEFVGDRVGVTTGAKLGIAVGVSL
jgi:predicted NUDIX family NTP pyrophosphohydrolase